MALEVLIAPTTAAAVSKPFQCNDYARPSEASGGVKVNLLDTVYAVGLAGAEVVTVKLAGPEGNINSSPLSVEGVGVVLAVDDNAKALLSCMNLVVSKGATAGAVGVYLQRAYG